MVMQYFLCESVAAFEGKLVEAQGAAGENPLVVLFTGAINADTGKSWCPDCTAAKPVVDSVLGFHSTDTVLLEVPIAREDFRNAALM